MLLIFFFGFSGTCFVAKYAINVWKCSMFASQEYVYSNVGCRDLVRVIEPSLLIVLFMSFAFFGPSVTEKDVLKSIKISHCQISPCFSDNFCFIYFETAYMCLELYFPGEVFTLLFYSNPHYPNNTFNL